MKNLRCLLIAVAMMCVLGVAYADGNTVVATSFPCYDFARRIAGESGEVRLLIRPGTEVHSYEPSPADILCIGEADLFVYVGGESDAWAKEILSSFGDDAPDVVCLSESVQTLEGEHNGHSHDHGALEWDEHIWTSPKNAEKMVGYLAEAMCAVMPEYEDAFRRNAEQYMGEIARIDLELQQIVDSAVRRELVFADRFPFIYLTHDYGLTYSAAFSSCATDTEPSAQVLVQLIQKILEEKIPVIYTIEMSTGAIARTLAEETGVDVLTLHSIQTVTQQEFDAGETYVTLMQKNLEAIEKGLN